MCDCPEEHPVRPSGKPGCPRYSADQEAGGRCRNCAAGDHEGINRYLEGKPRMGHGT